MSAVQFMIDESIKDVVRRPLIQGERRMIRDVFGEQTPDLDKVVILNRPRLSPVNWFDEGRIYRAHVYGNRAFFPATDKEGKPKPFGYFSDYSCKSVPLYQRSVFIHEMTHIWQNFHNPKRYDNKSRRELKALAETDPYLWKDNGKEATINDIFSHAADQARHKLAGTIPDSPMRSVEKASDYHAGTVAKTAQDVRESWAKNIDYNYLMPSQLDFGFYDMSQEQQAKVVQDYYVLNEETQDPTKTVGETYGHTATWRKPLPLAFYKAFIPFLPKGS